MELNVQDWKEFLVEKLFDSIYKAKAHTKEEVRETEYGLHFVSRTDMNNGVDISVEYDDYEGIEKKNCITIGDTTATCYYQNEDFIVGDHMVVLRAKWMNERRGLFIRTLFAMEYPRYSYGRAYRMELIKTTKMMLPIQYNSDGTPVIDNKKKYSDEGYIPDWQFMEDYIRSLNSEPLTTEVTGDDVPNLDVASWEEFLLSDYFDIVPGKYYSSEEYEEGLTPYYSASNENNGIGQMINLAPDFDGNCIVTGKIGSTAFYAPTPFCATSDVNVFKPKFEMNAEIGLFLANIINYSENYKWAYGRQCRIGNSKKIRVNLPAKEDGTPDWDFMERYIRSLPYGDRL